MSRAGYKTMEVRWDTEILWGDEAFGARRAPMASRVGR